MRKLFACLLIAASASANDLSYRSLQSGGFATPLHDRGLHGQGQIIAILDTGLDYSSCYFAEPGNLRPPVNTGTPSGGLAWQNIDLARRKVVAYNFLYSCDQFPGASGCDQPDNPAAWDNARHGTLAAAAAAGDRSAYLFHDDADSIAPGAKLIIQDGGFIGGDFCAQRPGFGCPVQLTPILVQAYKQGARIHSNSWGDRQGTPPVLPSPTANYPQSARDADAFIAAHPDLLVVFNTGNFSSPTGTPPASSVSAPGSAKNVIQVGGTRGYANRDDTVLANFTLRGPTRDGRIKPDLVAPSFVFLGDALPSVANPHCDTTFQQGTSWSSPTVAGAAALVRQYYTTGYYPRGVATLQHALTPSAALLKATLIAAARPVETIVYGDGREIAAQPVPSYEQGFGFPVLDDALYFTGDAARLRIVDSSSGLGAGESAAIQLTVAVGSKLKAVLVWTDPAGSQLVNDLDLRVTTPSGTLFGNERLHPGQADRVNNVEAVTIDTPSGGVYTIAVSATRIASGPRQSYALVLTGAFNDVPEPVPARRRSVRR